LSRQQVQSVFGFPIKSLVSSNTGNCIYGFSNRAGEVNFGLDVSSPDRARREFKAAETSDEGVSGLTLRHLTGIGQGAFLLVTKGQGTGVEALARSEVFTLQIYWTEAPKEPDIAITLAREAIARLHTAGSR
jgi:hypothetical protein